MGFAAVDAASFCVNPLNFDAKNLTFGLSNHNQWGNEQKKERKYSHGEDVIRIAGVRGSAFPLRRIARFDLLAEIFNKA